MTTTTQTDECIHLLDPRACSICRRAEGFAPGSDRHTNDCTVLAFSNLTGATYAEALEFMREAGRRNGQGASPVTARAAFSAAGFAMEPYAGTLDDAVRDGGSFYVSAKRRNRGHAYAIIDGAVVNGLGYTQGVRYLIWTVR